MAKRHRNVPKGPPIAYRNRNKVVKFDARYAISSQSDPFNMLGLADDVPSALNAAFTLVRRTKDLEGAFLIYDNQASGPDPIGRVTVEWFKYEDHEDQTESPHDEERRD